MRVIVTRPLREAKQWVTELLAAGIDALALPLIEVVPVPDPVALALAWKHVVDYAAVMFVSANAVDHFFTAKPDLVAAFSAATDAKTRAWATGPGTVRALLRVGVPAKLIDSPAPDAGQFDSEALWQLVGGQVHPGRRVLIVRGEDAFGADKSGSGSGREWFANHVVQAGATADFLVVYQRKVPELSSSELILAQHAASDGSVWLFSSSEALANLGFCLPTQNWIAARALATHPRIALAVRRAGFGVVHEIRPTLSDVLACLTDKDKFGSQHFKIKR
jgi:uroporphyrinogen-III synthase